MSVVPQGLDTERGPPMIVPLRHFVVGFGLLLAGGGVGAAMAGPAGDSFVSLVHLHLLLAGWVAVTIMGAMTQFVPVWSGVSLHSERLSNVQLWLVTVGLLGFAGSLFVGEARLLLVFGALMLAGFWVFGYNVARTLAAAGALDVTERHFAVAIGFFVVLAALGYLLAVDYTYPLFVGLAFSRTNVLLAHATLAVFGAVMTTTIGALYQLATMFTQSDMDEFDDTLQRVEEATYPVGVVALALGRLLDVAPLARIGGVLVVVGLTAFTVVFARRLINARVEWSPMLRRYAVVVPALALWIALSLPAWVADPLRRTTLFGAPNTAYLLILGVVGFVVWGTLYHVVPFIVWVHRYSDRLGFEPVPMIDDLYDDRVALGDFVTLGLGSGLLVLADHVDVPALVPIAGGLLLGVGSALFVTNMLLVVWRHSPYSVLELMAPSSGSRRDGSSDSSDSPDATADPVD